MKRVIRCSDETKECSFLDYNDLKDCADKKRVKCRIIDYTPLAKDYMEIEP